MHASLGIRLNRADYRRHPSVVARQLLGQRLVHHVRGTTLAGMIVETEAYLGIRDKAAHSYGNRRTARTETMYEDGGQAYVYLNYGLHFLFNVVVAAAGTPQAVLIRALQPIDGVEAMFARRPAARRLEDLCSGPGKLTAALGIHGGHNGLDLATSAQLYVERCRWRALPRARIVAAPRIGVDYAQEWAARPLRFYIAGNPHVSVALRDGVPGRDARGARGARGARRRG